MPRLDELLGVATLAATGLIVALALQPIADGAPGNGDARADAAVVAADVRAAPPVVRLPPLRVIAHRGVQPACGASEPKGARECLANSAARPAT